MDFVRELITELAKDELAKKNPIAGDVTREPNKKTYKQWDNDQSRLNGIHIPQQEKLTQPSNGRKLRRGHCIVCDRNENILCKQCNVYLCCEVDASHSYQNLSCWEKFHTHKKLVKR